MFFIRRNINWLQFFYHPQAWHNKFFIYNFFTCFTFLLLIWGEIIWGYFVISKNDFLSLHYSVYFGVDWVGPFVNFLILSGSATLIFAINFSLANLFYNKKRILSYLLLGSASMLVVLMFAALSLLMYINWYNLANY